MTNALVLSGMENLALSVIRTLGSKGATVTVGGVGAGSLLRLSRHCARAVVEAAAALARSCGATVVVPADVAAGLLVARLKERLPGVAFPRASR